MDITSDIIFSFLEKKFNHHENNDNIDKNKEKNNILTKGIILNSSQISTLEFNSTNLNVIYNFQNIEYLSLTHNFLRNIDFIEYLPNIYYLDLYKNIIDDFTPLNKKNIFGYIRLSIDHFNENKILQINGLTTVIFDVDLNETQLIKNIIYNNPKIIMLNNEINYIIDKVILKEQQKKGRRSSILKINVEVFEEEKINSSSRLNIKNKNLLELQKFFSRYTKRIDHILNVDLINTSHTLRNHKEYLEIEKKKLLLLNNCYEQLSKLNNNIHNFYISNSDSIYENQKINNIHLYGIAEKLKENKAIGEDSLKVSLIILTSILFLSLDIISKEITIIIINTILEKYFHIKKEDLIPLDFDIFDSVSLISIYYQLYDDLVNKFNIQNLKNIFYEEIIKILSMEKLILKSNVLNENRRKNKLEIEKSKLSKGKTKIKNNIIFINQLGIIEDFLILIQFLYDYILYEKIDKILLNKEKTNEYALFIEFKESIEQNYSESTQNVSLSLKKFNQTHIDILHQQFYFQQEKIKYMRNKLFPSNPKRIKLIKNYYNFENDYIPHDDIEIEDLFKIKKIKRNTNIIDRKYNSFMSNLPEVRTHHISNLTQTQRNNSNEINLLKKMINNNEFLADHTRYLINKEKQDKKLALIKKKEIENTEKNIQTKLKYDNNSEIISKLNNNKFLPINFSCLKKKKIKIDLPDFYSVKNGNSINLKHHPNKYFLNKGYNSNRTSTIKNSELNSFISITRYNEEELKEKLNKRNNRTLRSYYYPIKLNHASLENL